MPEQDASTPLPAETPPNPVDRINPLAGDAARQAVFPIRGIVYQAWCSIDAWLRLTNPDEAIYVEGAEDFDVVTSLGATTVQVKKTQGSISLGNAKAHEALNNYWALSNRETSRRIEFHYLTTSSVAMEKDAQFDGMKGIEAWRAAQTSLELAAKILEYLKAKLPASGSLGAFLATATPEIFYQRLIKCFHWFTDQEDIEGVKRSVSERIVVLLGSLRRSPSLSSKVQKQLESRFWEIVINPVAIERRLTRGDLLQQVEAATTAYLPIPFDQIPEFIGNAPPGQNFLSLLLQKTPVPPVPLLKRPVLTRRLEELVKQRRAILITGSIYKGKTTLAQLVASTLCPDAWWLNLTDRQPSQVDILLLSLATKIEGGDCPGLIVIDDLDISPQSDRAYHDSLRLVLHRADASGRGIILTARGASSTSAVVVDYKNIELLEVPEVDTEETVILCKEYGCPEPLSKIWGGLIHAMTSGHPKLVQVRIAELTAREWPKPGTNDLLPSPAVITARQMAHRLLSGSVSPEVAEFVYMVSECSILMHRSIAIVLAESITGLRNAGDVLDKLTGNWIEKIGSNWLRSTALIKGIAGEVWSEQKYRQVHLVLHDSIKQKGSLDPSEAAAMLFHAYVGQDRVRISTTALKLQILEDTDAKRDVQRHLLWLPYVALESGQSIVEDSATSVILRQLQFQVASTMDVDTIGKIYQRWREDIGQVSVPEFKSHLVATMGLQIGFSQNTQVLLHPRLKAVTELATLPLHLQDFLVGLTRTICEGNDVAAAGVPRNGTTAQMMLLFAINSVCDMRSLEELVDWLVGDASDEIAQQFEDMLDWPIVQSLGAFVQNAWATKHTETKDWTVWFPVLNRIYDYAKTRPSPKFGREAAKAESIILAEMLERTEDALALLDRAEATFGSSPVLLEQRANVLFHRRDDVMVLELWNRLTIDSERNPLDPFTFRRAGISAARLGRLAEAEQIFIKGSDSIRPDSLNVTKFALLVDAALVASLRDNQPAAATILSNAILVLPIESGFEGDQRWEAVQRVAVAVCRRIDASWKKKTIDSWVRPGDASSPSLKAPKAEPGQPARSEMMQVEILKVAASLGVYRPTFSLQLENLAASKYTLVRWTSAQARVAHSIASGAGAGFIRGVIALEAAFADLSSKREAMDPLKSDEGQSQNVALNPERWLGLVIAGMVSSGASMIDHLGQWLEESTQNLGADAALTNFVRSAIEGASRPAEILDASVLTVTNPVPIRCGAAARLLLDIPGATKTLELQQFLTSGIARDLSIAHQDLLNLHVARHFARQWRIHVENRFQFFSPRISVPLLITAIEDVENGKGTLRELLSAAANALSQSLHSSLDRVF